MNTNPLKLRLVIDVTYNAAPGEEKYLRRMLAELATEAASRGDFTGELASTVETYGSEVTEGHEGPNNAALLAAVRDLIEAADLAQCALTPVKSSPRQPQVNGALVLLPGAISKARALLSTL